MPIRKHHWNKHKKCLRCGVERKLKTEKLLMAIVNHPPYNTYRYTTKMAYLVDGKWIFQRPECKSKYDA